ncbi:MAG: histidine phosphatase family protein [Candidatus Omnitrophica bacterium]|nr:histidine phosphatase family protein [Candidatus Omnitrophota bacterium]
MTTLYLMRHGETEQGRARKYCGSLDVPLNDEGKRQAQMLSSRLDGVKIDAVFASDLTRAVQTASIVFKGAVVEKKPCFREMDFGACEGLSYEEARLAYPDMYEAWIHTPLEVTLPGGEAFTAFCARVTNGFQDLLAQYPGKNIALVSHGGPIRVIVCAALKRGLSDFWSIQQDNAALNVIEYDPVAKVILLNDTAHLKGSDL